MAGHADESFGRDGSDAGSAESSFISPDTRGVNVYNLMMLVQQGAEATGASLGDGFALIGVGIGIGFALIGAGIGLGRVGGEASLAIARQPEAAADIRGTALLIAFLMEGATIIAVIMALVAKLL